MVDREHSFTTTWMMPGATLQDVVGWIGRAGASAATETFLPGFREAGMPVIGSDADGESGDRAWQRRTWHFIYLPSGRNDLEVTLRRKNSVG